LDRIPELRDYPLLVRDDLPAKHLRSLQLLNAQERPIVRLQANTTCHVEQLIFLSDVCQLLERDPREAAREGDVTVSANWLKLAVETLWSRMSGPSLGKVGVFLNSTPGPVCEQRGPDLATWFAERGFLTERFDDCSFDYQLLRCRQAQPLVTALLSAVDSIFCPAGTRVLLLAPEGEQKLSALCAELAKVCGHTLTTISGPRLYRSERASDDDFFVRPDRIAEAMGND
jgi:hypothetical protein